MVASGPLHVPNAPIVSAIPSDDDDSSFCVADLFDAKSGATPPMKKSVRFAKRLEIQVIPSRRQLSMDEFRNSYMSYEDMQRIRNEVKGAIRKLQEFPEQEGQPGEEHNIDEFRGLESYEPEAHRARRQRMGRALTAVLEHQARNDGRLKERWVLYQYQDMTAASAWTAYLRGLMDQQIHRSAPPPLQMMIR